MKVGIVILNYNTFELTCCLAKKCLSMKKINKVVIVDNNSKDNFENFCQQQNNEKLFYIKNHRNSGYAAGNNLGLKFLYNNGFNIGIIANPDVDFPENTIDKIVQEFKISNLKYPVISCKRTLNGSKRTGQFWWIPSFYSSLAESLFLGRRFLNNHCVKKTNELIDELENRDSIEVEVVGGAFFAADLSFLDKIGYLDEGTFLWYEENILAYKVRESGKKELLMLNCEYEHNHKKKGRGNTNLRIFMDSKNYYCKDILKINFFQRTLLALLDEVGILEQRAINLLCKILERLHL